MAGWSAILRLRPPSIFLNRLNTCRSDLKASKNVFSEQRARMSGGGHRTMQIVPSRWQWHKFKDLLHFYIMVGAIPVTAIVLYANIFVGPATLTEIPEGYVPKHWEYYRHPISRFIARYMLASPQQDYEKMLHMLFEEEERIKLRKIEADVRAKMGERADYKGFYFQPMNPKYHRLSREEGEKLRALSGD